MSEQPVSKVGPLDPLPDFMVGDENRGKEHITADSCVWMGEDGELDPDVLLAKRGHDPETALERILAAIIRAHPLEGAGLNRVPTPQDRLEIALEALIGQPRQRGMNEADDYPMLLEIARRYYPIWFAQQKHPPVAPIAREVLTARSAERNEHNLDSAVRRLVRKFTQDRDVLLVRVTTESDWDRMDVQRSIDKVLAALRVLGIETAT